MEYYFITDSFKSEIKKNVIDSTFSSLNDNDKSMLFGYLINVIDIIAIKFNFDIDKKKLYEHQFRQNNYRDAMGLLLLLLPFIDDLSGNKKRILKSLSDLYTVKKENININESEPKYEYTNLQYGRCKRDSNIAQEIGFSVNHLRDNYLLLLETIQSVSHRLYTNWINIRPVDFATATTLSSFIETNKIITEHKVVAWDVVIDNLEGHNNKGLDASDIYNIVTNNLYYSIKDIKWTIYDMTVSGKNYKFIYLLNELLSIDNCVRDISWNLLDENSKIIFTQNWKKFVYNFMQNMPYGSLLGNDVGFIMRVIIIFFNNRYKHINQAIGDGYVKLNNISDDDINFEIDVSAKELKMIRRSVMSIENHPEYIYDYIKESLNEMKLTWYGQYYFKYNDGKYEMDKSPDPKARQYKNDDEYYAIKNVYNYAKSLCHYTNSFGEYTEFPRFWKSLNDDQKQTILKRLNWDGEASELMNWFNIMRYLTKITKKTKQEAFRKNKIIHDTIQSDLAQIIFQILSHEGLLTEFIPDADLSDQTMFVKNKNDEIRLRLGKKVINNQSLVSRWDNSYYFINGMQYKDIKIPIKRNGIVQNMKYIDMIADPTLKTGNWIYVYAMDWISQISFFHRYINNRVIYVTGGTGVGKSTQVPKLLLYALKMLDFKSNGKIACTQPRIPPTKNSAIAISSQMGIPITMYNASVDSEIKSNNYHIQYKYKEKSHDMKQNGLILKIMTDGTLETQLRNPLMKKMVGNTYQTENIYDIIVVDEAHEHNMNMDLILTKMKYVGYYNNDIKFVIISATMDEDEPVYRRYYRNINDNRSFPLNFALQKHNLDRINVDRRIHISPPGETTQYKITKYYRPNDNPINIVMEILQTSSSGDILLFQPGKMEIKKTVEELNMKIPDHIIAIPYHGDLSDEKKELVENLSNNLSKFVYPKDVQYDADVDEKNIKKVTPGKYKRAIIVATNIAEASITIDTLKFVIDTGTQKTNKYDYKTRGEVLQLTNISDSSMTQRTGRVGRVDSGTVYYIYNENDMKNNKRQFNISIVDFSLKLMDLLRESPEDEEYIINDPNNNKLDDSTIKLYKHGFGDIIKKQYFIGDTFYEYRGNNEHYDYENNEKPAKYYITGFDKDTLNDNKGEFYIVHPNELCFKRNILGKIVGIINCDMKYENETYISKKMETFWTILKEYLFIAEKDNDIYKTQFGTNIIKMHQKMSSISLKHLLVYIYGRMYNCTDDIIKLIAMHSTIKSPNDIASDGMVDGRYRVFFENALGLYGNSLGDSHALINISNVIIQLFQHDNPLSSLMNNKLSSTVTKNMENNKNNFIGGINNSNYKNVDKSILDDLLQMYYGNKMVLKNTIGKNELDSLVKNDVYVSYYLSEFKNKNYIENIRKWCEQRYLKYDNVMKFYEKYVRLLNEFKKYEEKLYDLDLDIMQDDHVLLEWFNSHTPKMITEATKQEGIVISLLHGFSYNLLKNIMVMNGKSYFINILNPNISYRFRLGKIFKPKFESNRPILNNTFLRKESMQSNIIYISKIESDDEADDEIMFIDNVPFNMIAKVLPQMIHNDERYDINKQEQLVRDFLSSLVVDKENNVILSGMTQRYIKTINEIKSILFVNGSKEKLTVIDDRENIKNIINGQYGGGDILELNYENIDYISSLIKVLNRKTIKI